MEVNDHAKTTPPSLVPPIFLCDSLIGAGIPRDRAHDRQIVLLNNLLHHLHRAKIPQHIPDAC